MSTAIIVAILLVVLFIAIRSAVRHFSGRGGGCCGSGDYKARKKKLRSVCAKKTFLVEGMMCQNCVNRVTECINDISGASASVNLRKGTVTVSMEKAMEDDVFIAAIEKAGYEVKGTIE